MLRGVSLIRNQLSVLDEAGKDCSVGSGFGSKSGARVGFDDFKTGAAQLRRQGLSRPPVGSDDRVVECLHSGSDEKADQKSATWS